jgi:hypothetical protein
MNFQRQMDMIADTLSITRAELDELSVQEAAKNEEADRSIVAASTTAEACT